ncbi:hypothetical protein ACFL3C_01640 [Patescibacteria group bacterium]
MVRLGRAGECDPALEREITPDMMRLLEELDKQYLADDITLHGAQAALDAALAEVNEVHELFGLVEVPE